MDIDGDLYTERFFSALVMVFVDNALYSKLFNSFLYGISGTMESFCRSLYLKVSVLLHLYTSQDLV